MKIEGGGNPGADHATPRAQLTTRWRRSMRRKAPPQRAAATRGRCFMSTRPAAPQCGNWLLECVGDAGPHAASQRPTGERIQFWATVTGADSGELARAMTTWARASGQGKKQVTFSADVGLAGAVGSTEGRKSQRSKRPSWSTRHATAKDHQRVGASVLGRAAQGEGAVCAPGPAVHA